MDPKAYCDVCKIFCGDATGILLHMISVEHYQAYQSYLRQCQKKNKPTIEQKCGNRSGANHQKGVPENMDLKAYCDVCKIFCGDARGILFHMISVEHHQAYQSYLGQCQRNNKPTIEQKCANSSGANHQTGRNPFSNNHKEAAPEMSQNSLDELRSSIQRMFLCDKNEDILANNECAVLSFLNKNSCEVPKKKEIVQIIVTGFSCSLETVRESFSKLGCILAFQVIGGIVCITYRNKSSFDHFLGEAENNKIILNKTEFKIITHLLKPVKGYKMSQIPDSMENMFSSGRNLESKMKELMLETELDSSERRKQNQVYFSVVQCLHDRFNPVAHPFGSRVAGLGTKTSDLDIHLEIKTPFELVEQINAMSDLEEKTIKRIVHSIGDCLQANEDFSHIVRLPMASTAIVKCMHLPTRIRCDLSFQAPYGISRTSLIFFYISLDYRVKPLLVFIRSWAKIHGFSGMNKFHNYPLSLMVIFYLQQISILPSAATLMNNLKDHERNLIRFWECGFSKDISLLPKIEITFSFLEVLKGFFQFYSKFDFEKYVVSPYLGIVVEKRLFVKGLESVYPSQFAQYLSNCKDNGHTPLKVITEVCVQDFFVHNCNVAVSLRYWRILNNFIAYCDLYARVCDSIYETYMQSSDIDKMLQERYQKLWKDGCF